MIDHSKELHVVFETGPVGLSVMDELVKNGKRVRLVNRSGKVHVSAGVATPRKRPSLERPAAGASVVALEVVRAGTDLQTSDDFVRRLLAYFSALPSEEFSHHVELAPLLARVSTDDQFQFGIRTFLAGLEAQGPAPKRSRPQGGSHG